ncbi:helix-turn-helix domain-containing protein [Nonomuraea typhae]|uniref:Helix-turn-helix domain-containing protein n=1 Tax=Nonomuraea typhae TaxID=2603600 RepID=A0ABW7YXV1_9ACTN
MPQRNAPDEGPLIHTIPEVMHLLRLSRRTVEEMIRTGELESVKIRGLRRVHRQSVLALLDPGSSRSA